MIIPGHGLLLKGFFADGSECSYNRPFLVLENTGEVIRGLNVSSVKGKEHKLMWPSNKKLDRHNPPFHKLSMVKLDELYEFEYCSELESKVMSDNRPLYSGLLGQVQSWFTLYSDDNKIKRVYISKKDFLDRNSLPSIQ